MPISVLHQHAAADHLRRQIEGRHGDDGDRADDAHLLRVIAVGQDVGQRVLADVAAGLGDHQQHRDVGDQPAHRVHEAVVAVQRDQAGDAEERCRAEVVAGDRPAVLQTGDTTAGRVEVGRRLHPLGGEEGDEHRHPDDRREDGEGQPAPFGTDGTLRECGKRDQRQRERAGREVQTHAPVHACLPMFSASAISSRAIASNSRFARRA